MNKHLLFDDYYIARQAIFDYFGYVEDWVRIPLEDFRDYYWAISGEGSGCVLRFAASRSQLLDEEKGDYYKYSIYTQRFLPKWVYRKEEFTMVCVDTHTDGNHYLAILENEYEVPWSEIEGKDENENGDS